MRHYKVYGIYGMNEVKMIFRCGLAKVNVTFSQGSTAGIGITPAQFHTEDPIIQNVIESSDRYKSGGIRLIKSEVIEEDEEVVDDFTDSPSDDAHNSTKETEETTDVRELIQVEVSSLADAKEYLATAFGYKKTQLRGVESVKQAGLSHGVEFVGSLD